MLLGPLCVVDRGMLFGSCFGGVLSYFVPDISVATCSENHFRDGAAVPFE